MQIKKVYIEQFGKIVKKEISFHPEINIIYGENESGKSTLENFILTMFYGHKTSRKYGVDARVQYIPFGKEFTFGHMVFEKDGKSYVVERKMGQKRKDDFFRSFDEVTYDQASFDEHLGKALFDLELEPFLKTLFVSQNTTRFYPEKDESLNTKLTNLLETGDEDISFTKAMDTIDKEMKFIKSPRKSGALDELYEKLSSLYERLDLAKNRREKLDRLEKKLFQTELTLKSNKIKREKISHLKDTLHLYEVREEVFQIFNSLESIAKIKEEHQTRKNVLSTNGLQSFREEIEELEKDRELMASISEDLHKSNRELMAITLELEPYFGYTDLPENTAITLVGIQGEEKLILEKLKQFEAKSNIPLGFVEKQEELTKLLHQYEVRLKKLRPRKSSHLIASLVAVTSLTLSMAIFKNLLYGFFGVGILSATLLLIKSFSQRKQSRRLFKVERIEEKINILAKSLEMDPIEVIKAKKVIEGLPKKKERISLQNQLGKIQEQKQNYFNSTGALNLDGFIQGEGIYKTLVEEKKDILRRQKDLEKELRVQSEKVIKSWDNLLKNLMEYGYDKDQWEPDDFLDSYEQKMQRELNLISQEDSLWYTLKSLIGEKSPQEFKEDIETMEEMGLLEGTDLELVRDKEQQYGDKEIQLSKEIVELTEGKNALQGEEPLLIEDEISSWLEEEVRLERKYLVLQTTRELMMDTYEELRSKFIRELNEKVSMIFQTITKSSRQVKVAEYFSMVLEEDKRIRPEDYLSKGSIDQLYLSLRLAMADLIFDGEKVPIFLDEPFVSYDGERLANVLNYLLQNKEKYQVFIFTCHEREMAILKDYGHVIYL